MSISDICQAWGPSAHLTEAAIQEKVVLASKSRVLTGLFQTLQAAAFLGHTSKLEDKLEIAFTLPFRCFIATLPFFTAVLDATVGESPQASPGLKKRVEWLHTHIGFLYQAGSIATNLFLLYFGCRAYAMTFLAHSVIQLLIKQEIFPAWAQEGYQAFSYSMKVISDFTYGRTLFQALVGIEIIRLCLQLMSTQAKSKPDEAIG